MDSTFNNTPHVGNTSSGTSSRKGSSSSGSSYSAGSTGSVSPSSSVGTSSVGSSSSVSSSADKLSGQAGNLIDKVKNVDYQQQINMLKEKAGPAYDYSVDYVKTNPMLAIGGAAVIGFFAGMFFSRKSY